MSTHASRMLRHISPSSTSPTCAVHVSKAASACVGRRAGVPHALCVQRHSTQAAVRGLTAATHYPAITLMDYQRTSYTSTSTSTALWSAFGTRREFSVAAAARSPKVVDDHDVVDSDVDSDVEEDYTDSEIWKKDGDDGVKDEKRGVTWPPGTPPPGRKQRLGEMWAQMEYHGRGTRKVKVKFFHDLLRRVEKAEDVKYAKSALKLFKKQGSPIERPTVTLYIKTCCRAGAPLEALAAVDDLPKDKVSTHVFKYLLLELYIQGHAKALVRAVKQAKAQRRRECKGMYHAYDLLLRRRQGLAASILKAKAKAQAQAEAEAAKVTGSEEAAAGGDDAPVSSEGAALEIAATGGEAAVEEGSSEEGERDKTATR